jgi:transposase
MRPCRRRGQPLAALGTDLRGIDGGKLIKGIKLSAVCDKHGSLLDLELAPANTDDRAGATPMLPRLAELGFQGDLLGDSGYKGMPFAQAALDHDIHVSVSPGETRNGQFLPVGIRWVVERLFAWLSRHRRLNTVFGRKPDLFATHVWIAMIAVIARRPASAKIQQAQQLLFAYRF